MTPLLSVSGDAVEEDENWVEEGRSVLGSLLWLKTWLRRLRGILKISDRIDK